MQRPSWQPIPAGHLVSQLPQCSLLVFRSCMRGAQRARGARHECPLSTMYAAREYGGAEQTGSSIAKVFLVGFAILHVRPGV
jgi:hypothetical protein